MGGGDFFVEFLEAFKLRGEAAFAGCVYDEDCFALETGGVEWFALFWGGGRVLLVI